MNEDFEIIIISFVIISAAFVAGLTWSGQKTDVAADDSTVIMVEDRVEVGEYKISFKKDVGDATTVGRTTIENKAMCLAGQCFIFPFKGHSDKEIWIEVDRPLGEIYQTCVHEVKHSQYTWMTHPWYDWFIEAHGENTYEEVCVEATAELYNAHMNH